MIDSHQHFWNYDSRIHDWITDDMDIIRGDFLPGDLEPILAGQGIEGCIAVQADQSEEETDFLLDLAAKNDFIKGIVGWVDLRDENVEESMSYYHQFERIKGFRHVLQGESPEFMLQPDFLRGIGALQKFGFTYDILIIPKHLKAALALVSKFPDQPFVIDHIAKPEIMEGEIEAWKNGMEAIARHPNVYCKVSGMVTESNWTRWKPADFSPYLDVVTAAFGPARLMYGSDWPVCLVAASYEQMFGIVKDYYASFSEGEQSLIFGGNAARFYKIS